jgi:hypothetical protein
LGRQRQTKAPWVQLAMQAQGIRRFSAVSGGGGRQFHDLTMPRPRAGHKTRGIALQSRCARAGWRVEEDKRVFKHSNAFDFL